MGETINIRAIQALTELRNALGRFTGSTQEALAAVEPKIRRTQEWLREREAHWQREVEKAWRAYEVCRSCRDKDGRPPPCSAEWAALQRTEAELRRVQYWRARGEQAVAEYRGYARRLRYLVIEHTERAQALLERKRAELEAYVAVPVPSVALGVPGEAMEGTQVPHQYFCPVCGRSFPFAGREFSPQQVQQAAQTLQQIHELRPDVWRELDFKSRLKVLQSVENKMAEVHGRPSALVKTKPMKPGEFGGYDRETRIITLNEVHIKSGDIREITDTVVHEGRHAYQHYAVEHPSFHPDAAQVETWRHNFDHYLPAEIYGQEIYESQPIEADARDYADEIITALFGGD